MNELLIERQSVLTFLNRRALDLPTVGLGLAMWMGLAVAYEGHRRGWLPGLAATGLGLLAMNLAFTVWHEAVHQSLSNNRVFNHLLGRLLGAVPVFIPYSRLQVHHLLHHRFTNDPDKDPDYWQIRGSFWSLGLRYLEGEREGRRLYLNEGPATSQVLADRLQLGFGVVAVAGLAIASPLSVLFAIVIPRILLIYVHALYVNYLPHAGLPAGRYESSRILLVGRLLSWLMLRHNYHALHHAYPAIPWHNYARAYDAFREDLARHGITSLGPGQLWPLLRGHQGAGS